MKHALAILLSLGLLAGGVALADQQQQQQQQNKPAPQAAAPVHYVHPPATHAAPVVHNPVPVVHQAPDQFHPAPDNRPVHVYTPTTSRNVQINNRQAISDVTNYHINQYHTTVNIAYAAHPGSDRGTWTNGWYHGYWHDYWINENWAYWGNHYGFWLNLDGANVFVYEYAPGVCWYWNGYEYRAWYNPPYTPYQCPY